MSFSMMEFVKVVNRTTEPLEVTFNGVPRVLAPGYRLENGKAVPAGAHGELAYTTLPAPFAEFAKRQNPRMGSFDPETANGFEPLVGVQEWGDDISFLPQSDAKEVLDRELLDDTKQHAEVLVTTAGRRGARTRSMVADPKLKSPTGLKTDYPD